MPYATKAYAGCTRGLVPQLLKRLSCHAMRLIFNGQTRYTPSREETYADCIDKIQYK